jgi:hypothetical protein
MTEERPAAGFEHAGEFYPWRVGDTGKDLMLIDRFSGLSITEFFALVDDPVDSGRAPVVLAMIACSIRARHPDWSVERITRTVMNLSLSEDVTFLDPDTEEVTPDPTAAPASEAGTPTGGSSSSPSNGSSPSSILPGISVSATSSETPP